MILIYFFKSIRLNLFLKVKFKNKLNLSIEKPHTEHTIFINIAK